MEIRNAGMYSVERNEFKEKNIRTKIGQYQERPEYVI
jgi:hypothetical protein